MTIRNYDEHAYEIVTEEGTFAVCKDDLAKFDATKHEHGVAVCGCCGCCFTGDCCNDADCKHCEGKHCAHACHENREGHECAFCHLAFDTNEKCHEEILADLKELKAELAA
ncbi:lectin-C [Bifidobacterium catulorum]|uniref:lectin-C n=1 Tax=Bifidobacterium catulorum TaxID=1630173 RepID=UPI001474068E|nr:lectin-C [Bifidobacterium catulorum]